MKPESIPEGLKQSLLKISRELQGPVLGIDTASMAISVCFVDWWPAEVRELCLSGSALPSEALGQAVADAMEASGVVAQKLGAVVVTLGPGSFTGLRVGLALAKGLAYGAGVSLYGASHLAVLAASAGVVGYVAPVLDARHEEVFAALYRVDAGGRLELVLAEAARAPGAFVDELAALWPTLPQGARLWCVGDYAERLCRLMAARPDVTGLVEPTVRLAAPRAAFGILAAEQRLMTRQAEGLASVMPRYMRLAEPQRQLLAKQERLLNG